MIHFLGVTDNAPHYGGQNAAVVYFDSSSALFSSIINVDERIKRSMARNTAYPLIPSRDWGTTEKTAYRNYDQLFTHKPKNYLVFSSGF